MIAYGVFSFQSNAFSSFIYIKIYRTINYKVWICDELQISLMNE